MSRRQDALEDGGVETVPERRTCRVRCAFSEEAASSRRLSVEFLYLVLETRRVSQCNDFVPRPGIAIRVHRWFR